MSEVQYPVGETVRMFIVGSIPLQISVGTPSKFCVVVADCRMIVRSQVQGEHVRICCVNECLHKLLSTEVGLTYKSIEQ